MQPGSEKKLIRNQIHGEIQRRPHLRRFSGYQSKRNFKVPSNLTARLLSNPCVSWFIQPSAAPKSPCAVAYLIVLTLYSMAFVTTRTLTGYLQTVRFLSQRSNPCLCIVYCPVLPRLSSLAGLNANSRSLRGQVNAMTNVSDTAIPRSPPLSSYRANTTLLILKSHDIGPYSLLSRKEIYSNILIADLHIAASEPSLRFPSTPP
jgi:hypothetical protein